MTQPKLKQEQLNKSINASRDQHSLIHVQEGLGPQEKILKDQIGTDHHGDEVTAKLEAPSTNQKNPKDEKEFTADTPLQHFLDQSEINKIQNKENHLSYQEELAGLHGVPSENRENMPQNLQINENSIPAAPVPEIRRHQQNIAPANPAQPVHAQRNAAQPLYYVVPSQRRRAPIWLVALIIFVFACMIVAIVVWGVLKHKKAQVAKKFTKTDVVQPFKYITVPPKIADPIVQSELDPFIKDLPLTVPAEFPKIEEFKKKPINKASKITFTSVKTTVGSSKPASSPILLSRGDQISCPMNQLLVNGNCLSCAKGEEWFGLDCVPIVENHRHMKKRYY